MEVETAAPLPSVEAVLDKVKSDGTFDQFRKACLTAVEAEPSMRAYGEQIEVLSRRYLQDHSHKWSDSVTKNEVRAKLKDYIVKMIANPDVGISIPVQNMVERSLEKNGPKILLPQIVDAVAVLQKAARSVPTATSSTAPSSEQSHADTSTAGDTAPAADKADLGPLNLPLPISIPGLTSGGSGGGSRKESGGASEAGVKTGSKKESSAETVTAKTKPKAKTGSDTSASTSSTTGGGGGGGGGGGVKEAKQGMAKGQKSNQNKGNQLGSIKTRDTKHVTDDKDEGKEAPEVEDSLAKEKGSGKVKRTVKEDKGGQSNRELEKQSEKKGGDGELEKQSEKKAIDTRDTESMAAEVEEGGKKESSEKEIKEKTTRVDVKPEGVSEPATEQKQDSTSGAGETRGSVPEAGGNGATTSRRKQAAPKRRSARLASLNEESADEQGKTAGEKGSGNSKKQAVEDVISRDKVVSVLETGRKRATATEKSKPATTASKAVSGRKRLRVLESSSEEESVTTQQQSSSGAEEERGYESETEQQEVEEEEEEREGKGRKRKRVRGRKKWSRNKDNSPPQSQTSESKRQLGRKRSLGVSKDDEQCRSSSPVSKKVRTKKQLQEDRKRSPVTQKSPSPVVVTRYNRRVKPNRRYTSPRDSDSSMSNEDTENKSSVDKN